MVNRASCDSLSPVSTFEADWLSRSEGDLSGVSSSVSCPFNMGVVDVVDACRSGGLPSMFSVYI